MHLDRQTDRLICICIDIHRQYICAPIQICINPGDRHLKVGEPRTLVYNLNLAVKGIQPYPD